MGSPTAGKAPIQSGCRRCIDSRINPLHPALSSQSGLPAGQLDARVILCSGNSRPPPRRECWPALRKSWPSSRAAAEELHDASPRVRLDSPTEVRVTSDWSKTALPALLALLSTLGGCAQAAPKTSVTVPSAPAPQPG